MYPADLQSFFDTLGAAPNAGTDAAASQVAPETLPPGTPPPAAPLSVPESAGAGVGSLPAAVSAPPAAGAPTEAPAHDATMGLQGVSPDLLRTLHQASVDHPTFVKGLSLAALAMANPQLASQVMDQHAHEIEHARSLLAQLAGQESALARAQGEQHRLASTAEKKSRYEQIRDVLHGAEGTETTPVPTDVMNDEEYQKWVLDNTKAISKGKYEKQQRKEEEDTAKRLQEARGKAVSEIRRYIDLGTTPDEVRNLVPSILEMAGVPPGAVNPQMIDQLISAGSSAASALARERQAKEDALKVHQSYISSKLANMQEENKQAWAKIANGKLNAGAQYVTSADARLQQLDQEITTFDGYTASLQSSDPVRALAYSKGAAQLKTQRDALKQNMDLMRNDIFEGVMGNKPQVAFNGIFSRRITSLVQAFPVFFQGPDATNPEVWLQAHPDHDVAHNFWDGVANELSVTLGQNPAAPGLARNYVDALAFQHFGVDVVEAFGDESTRSTLSVGNPSVFGAPQGAPPPGGAEPPK